MSKHPWLYCIYYSYGIYRKVDRCILSTTELRVIQASVNAGMIESSQSRGFPVLLVFLICNTVRCAVDLAFFEKHNIKSQIVAIYILKIFFHTSSDHFQFILQQYFLPFRVPVSVRCCTRTS